MLQATEDEIKLRVAALHGGDLGYWHQRDISEAEGKGSNIIKFYLDQRDISEAEGKGSNIIKFYLDQRDISEAEGKGSNIIKFYLDQRDISEAEGKRSNIIKFYLDQRDISEAEGKGSNIIKFYLDQRDISEAEGKGSNIIKFYLDQRDISEAEGKRSNIIKFYLDQRDISEAEGKGSNIIKFYLDQRDISEAEGKGSNIIKFYLDQRDISEAEGKGSNIIKFYLDQRGISEAKVISTILCSRDAKEGPPQFRIRFRKMDRHNGPTMYPYQTPVSQIRLQQTPPVSSRAVSLPPPPPSHDDTKDTHNATWLNTVQTRLKLSPTIVTLVPSILACMTAQAVAAFFLITTALTFTGAVSNAKDFSDDKTHDGNVLFIVFSVFSAIASAMCAPMIQNSGYSIIILAGVILMMFSTLSSSVVTSAEILVIPFSVFGACAYGLLKTGPQVAMLDFLNDRRGLAAGLNYLAVTIGQLAGVMSFSFSDMADDASYSGKSNARWPNNLRVIEVTAVFALMSAAVIRKPSFATGNWPQLFQYVPFYVLCVINFFVSFGFDMLDLMYSEAPKEREFETHPSGSHEIFTVSFISQIVEFFAVILLLIINGFFCKGGGIKKITMLLSAIFVAVLSLASYINEPAYKKFPAFAVYGSIAGFAKAVIRVCLPIAMITFTGRINYKVGLPFLEVSGGLGELISYSIKDRTEMPDEEPLETGWYIAAAFFTLVSALCVFAHLRFVPWDIHVAETEQDEDVFKEVSGLENAAFTPVDGLGDLAAVDLPMP
ncbi:hypothetical protein RRG08_009152 [Elysia crispata]|uniref:Uncharacterized protein n=1 Tax=Elysia crispata TaxID=231223 RepID=A0AAE1CSR9_9GAST|nr:hypothetical protein RRG08_009152 [Elysia crispata]